jgi:UDP-hydrolysing UDP-N-acetyl-D-glucosamine 2-epimerase
MCFISSSRADYDLLSPLMKRVNTSKDLDFQLIVSGAHFIDNQGLTIQRIIEDGFEIHKEIKFAEGSTRNQIIRNLSSSISDYSGALLDLKPDAVVLLGDRYEIFGAAISAFINNIPIIHLHGGELTLSAQDDAFRHSITKMSTLHFVAHEIYRKRVIQLGENPKSVFCVGPLVLDNLLKDDFYNKKEVEELLNFNFFEKNLLITFHPETLKQGKNQSNFNLVLTTLRELENTGFIFTAPNIDYEGDLIRAQIEDFVKEKPDSSLFVNSMGSKLYLSTMICVDCVLGNSSSGVIEAPLLKIPTLNLGDRQIGRIKFDSVIDCDIDKKQIDKSLELILSSELRNKIKKLEDPFLSASPSEKIYNEIINFDFSEELSKNFYDLNFE